MESPATSFVAFEDAHRLAAGTLVEVALAARLALAGDPSGPVLVFDTVTGAVVDLDLRGEAAEVAARYQEPAQAQAPARGRPKLGVVAREVTLLPRHWDWLAVQPGGASAALRRLVEAAGRDSEAVDRARAAREAAYRFMAAIGGDLPGFEDAARALFAGDEDAFQARIDAWPADLRDQLLRFTRTERS